MAQLVLAPKPEFAPTGNACVCPNCGYSAIFFRTDLYYRAGESASIAQTK